MKTLTLISIHALRGEGDTREKPMRGTLSNFNPRPPWGGRLCGCVPPMWIVAISIHALRGEGDITFIFIFCVIS